MVKDVAIKMLNLIRNDDGVERIELLRPSMENQKILDLILAECRCSIIDKDGNYSRFGSSTDIRVIKILIQLFLSDAKEIPPEVVSMALTKEGVVGPFMKMEFHKKYDGIGYELEMEDVFPQQFSINVFKDNLQVKEKFINEIIKPYVKNIIFENDILMSKSPIGAYINKYIIRTFVPQKTDEQLEKDLISILETGIDANRNLVENIANYIYINIMNNVYFKEELINRTLDATELQKLGRISIGFGSLVENMSYETLQMIELKSFPYGELISIKNTFYTVTAVLEALVTNLENLDEKQILKQIERVNKNFNNRKEIKYREKEVANNKFGTPIEFVKKENIISSMENLCRMIKVLLDKKDEIDGVEYIREVIRIHYRFIRIQPFDRANGRTARAIVNMLLSAKGMLAIFRKEKRGDYIEYINEANRVIKENEERYVEGLSKRPMECVEFENEFLDSNDEFPFLLVKN